MATLRKIKDASTSNTYTITVERGVDVMKTINTYQTTSPETDIIVQLLIYARKNHWSISQWDTKQELMQQLENYLTDDEILEVDLDTLKANIDDIADELNGIAPNGIEYITIENNGDEYELDVTKDDIRKIFLDLI